MSTQANDIVATIKAWAKVAGVKVVVDRGALTRGRAWDRGIRGVVEHHTAGVGDGVIEYMANRKGNYPFCNASVRRDGTIVILSALSAWGSGEGGPWEAAGVPKDRAHAYLWQTEYESEGLKKDFTPEMWVAQAALDCAMRQTAGVKNFPNFERLINHRDWTDGGKPLGMDDSLPTKGRKIDTRYPAAKFRANAEAFWQINNGKVAV